MGIAFGFEKLIVYQKARNLVTHIYELTNKFPDAEKFGLVMQLKRAAISVPSNIAEGLSRQTVKNKVSFIEIAYGSLMEMYCQLQLAKDLNFINDEKMDESRNLIIEISKLLSGLRSSFNSKL